MRSVDVDIVLPRSAEEMQAHAAAWSRLHTQRLDDNPYASPQFLVPLLRNEGFRDFGLALMYAVVDGRSEMIASTLIDRACEGRYPLRHRRLGGHPFVLDGTPLLHAEHAQQAAEALATSLPERLGDAGLLAFASIDMASGAWQALTAVLRARGRSWWVRGGRSRPVQHRQCDFDGYLAGLSSKRRSGWRACLRRAESAGRLRVLRHDGPVDAAVVDRFLQLEAGSWKGAAGTSMVSDRAHAAFLHEMTRGSDAGSRVLLLELQLDDQPIAMSVNLAEGARLCGFKCAFDPAHRQLAPGILNLVEVVRLMHQEPGLQTFDGGGDENSFAAPLVHDRSPTGEVLFATPGRAAEMTLRALPLARELRDRTRRWAGILRTGAA